MQSCLPASMYVSTHVHVHPYTHKPRGRRKRRREERVLSRHRNPLSSLMTSFQSLKSIRCAVKTVLATHMHTHACTPPHTHHMHAYAYTHLHAHMSIGTPTHLQPQTLQKQHSPLQRAADVTQKETHRETQKHTRKALTCGHDCHRPPPHHLWLMEFSVDEKPTQI